MSCLRISSLLLFCLMLRSGDTVWTTPITYAENTPEKNSDMWSKVTKKECEMFSYKKKDFYYLNWWTLTIKIPWIDIWIKLIHLTRLCLYSGIWTPFLTLGYSWNSQIWAIVEIIMRWKGVEWKQFPNLSMDSTKS